MVKATDLQKWGIILSFYFLLPTSAWAQSYEEAVRFRNRGLGQQRAGDFEGAFNFYQKALRLHPDLSIVHNDLGTLCESQGWLEEAQRAYQQALSLNPPYRLAEYNLALLYERQGDVPKAIHHLEHFLFTSDHDDRWTPYAQARLDAIRERLRRREEEHRREEEEVRQIREEKRQRHQKISELFQEAKRASRAKRYEEALESLEALLALDSQNRAGWEYYQTVRKKKAVAEHGVLKFQRTQKAREKQARLAQFRRQKEEQRIRQARQEAREKKETILEIQERGQPEAPPVTAKEQEEEVLQKERQRQFARLFEKGENAYRQHRYEEAFEIFETLLKQDPGNPDVEDYRELTRPFIKRRTRYSGYSTR